MSESLPGTISEVKFGGQTALFFAADPKDEIQKHHLSGSFYELDELTMMANHVKPYASILEVGANVGNHTVYFDRFLHPRKIIVVEPNPDAIRLLQINLRLNHCHTVDSTFLGIGLGATDSRARVVPSRWDNNLGGAELHDDVNGNIVIRSGDSVFANERFDFIKIDVEGMEIEVLQGLTHIIATQRPVMFVEIRDEQREAFKGLLASVRYAITFSCVRYENVTNYLVQPR